MSTFYIILTVIISTLGLIILVVFRIYFRTHRINKETGKLPSKTKDDLEEVKKRENFRQYIRNFLQKY